VRRGEVIGIIGRNGAGKTTLLKILSRITEPTEGWAEIRGRVGSLLEVGTGFHPELTGRENIYLNGAILGMRKVEINRKFDEIVAFAEIEKFIDTPVKRYSSGMYVRLAFAVAAHLEPEILLVDEVLAVGDAVFQKKCLGKMGQVAGEGRTVLFVSHNMSAVQRLCKRVYLLEEGKIITSGDAAPVVDAYYRFTMDRNDPVTETRDVPEGTVRFLKWGISRSSAGDPYSCYTGEPCTISLQVVARRVVRKASFGIALWSNDGILIWAMRNLDHGGEHAFIQEGLYQIDFSVPQFPVKPGSYQIQVSVNDDFGEGALDIWYAQPKFVILPKKESGISRQWQGIVNISGEFNLSLIGNHGTGVGSS
jgi:lipopolysaccharide transport system ATP-binding protein